MRRRTKQDKPSSPSTVWYRSTFAIAVAGGILLYAAFPPIGFWPLVFVGPVFWLILILRPDLTGRHPLGAIWLASTLHWLIMLEGIRKAHWANYFGWVALSCYLAVYLPCFVALTRVAVQRLRISLLIAAPVVWTGLELARGYLITGFSMALLGHALYDQTTLIQISDLIGAYAVSFFVMFIVAGIALMVQARSLRRAVVPSVACGVATVAVILYGQYRTRTQPPVSEDRTLKVALIQESVDKRFEFNPQRNLDTFNRYRQMSVEARDHHPDLDLIVWPESVFAENLPEYVCNGPFAPPPDSGLDIEEARERYLDAVARFQDKVRGMAEEVNLIWDSGDFRSLNIYLLVGSSAVDVANGNWKDYNAALLIHPEGFTLDRYYKMHPVMFGEYLPFGHLLPWLYDITPMHRGLSVGKGPTCFEVQGSRLAPSICFESTVPQLIRSHVRQLSRTNQAPDILVNVTDDGWFKGASILDYQLASGVFRAVELRRPFLVAANTGISAIIDGNGSIQQRGPRQNKQILVGQVGADGRWSLYEFWGDLPAALCLLACLALLLVGLIPASRFGNRPGDNRKNR